LGVDDFAAKLGITGDGTKRQLGFGTGIPVWARDEANIVQEIRQGFDTAKRTNVAVHFRVDDHIGWDERPDLWNWYDPARRGYNPDNRKNVEWYDFQVCSLESGPLRAAGGIRVEARRGLNALRRAGTIVIPGWPRPLSLVR
jgi:hypothetical protein